MNKVILIGRLTKDPELRYVESTGTAITRFALAVDRPFAKKDAEVTADFFNIIVWGKRAESCANYLAKGRLVAISGRIENNNFEDKNGNRQYSVAIIAENVQFLEWGDKENTAQDKAKNNIEYDTNAYKDLENDEDMPF